MKILNFLFELIVVGLMGIPIIYEAEAVDYQQSVLIPSQIINGTSAVGLGAFAMSSGFAVQVDMACPGACTLEVAIAVSVDGVTYQNIPELVKTYTTSTTAVFNIYAQYYKFYRVTVTESSTNPATIAVTQATKGQL